MALVSPTVQELADIMPQRLRGEFANETTFNDNTEPTAERAQSWLDIALGIVSGRMGDALPVRFEALAQTAVLFKAAALVEVSIQPEQANNDDSAYTLYQAQFVEVIDALTEGIRGHDSTAKPGIRSFPMKGAEGTVILPIETA